LKDTFDRLPQESTRIEVDNYYVTSIHCVSAPSGCDGFSIVEQSQFLTLPNLHIIANGCLMPRFLSAVLKQSSVHRCEFERQRQAWTEKCWLLRRLNCCYSPAKTDMVSRQVGISSLRHYVHVVAAAFAPGRA
jgi:hypothetical protein